MSPFVPDPKRPGQTTWKPDKPPGEGGTVNQPVGSIGWQQNQPSQAAQTVAPPPGQDFSGKGAEFLGVAGATDPRQEQQEQEELNWMQKLSRKLWGEANIESLENQRAQNEAVYNAKNTVDKVIYQAETVLMAAGESGILGNIIGSVANLVSTKLSTSASKAATNAYRSGFPDPFKHVLTQKQVNYLSYAVKTNAKTKAASSHFITQVAKSYAKPAAVAGLISAYIGTTIWSEWSFGEAKEIMGIIESKVIDTGDLKTMQEYKDLHVQIFDRGLLSQISRGIPAANIAINFLKKAQVLNFQRKLNDQLVDDEMEKIQTGTTDAEILKKREQEYEDRAKRIADYIDKLATARDAANAKLAADQQLAWIDYAKMKNKWDKENQDFWLAYLEKKYKMMEDQGRSTLGFGLF